MLRRAGLRTAALALILYGLFGFLVGATVAIIGYSTFQSVDALRGMLDSERGSLALSLRGVSRTVGDSADATGQFQQTLDGARQSADSAAALASQTAASFRNMAQQVQVQIFGIEPLGGLAPQFQQSADQLDQLAATLASTRDALQSNSADVARVGGDLRGVQQQVNTLAATLDRAGVLVPPAEAEAPFKLAFLGMCALFALQSLFSLLAGIALLREHESILILARLVAQHRREQALRAKGEPLALPAEERVA